MTKKHTVAAFILAAATCCILPLTACERDTSGLGPTPLDTNPVVFQDVFDGIDFQAFLGTKLDAFSVVGNVRYLGTAAIQVTVPDEGDPAGSYAGGAITSFVERDLSQYNALAFWARASQAATLDIVGFGNDNTGTSKYVVGVGGLALTTSWQRFLIPVPRTGKLGRERGLFYFADAHDNGSGYTIWLDEIEFVNVDAISNPRPLMRQRDVSTITGLDLYVEETSTTFDVTVPTPRSIVVEHSPGYFTYISSNEDVARPGEGLIRIVGGGTADITAKLGTVAVAGRFKVSALDPPTDAAPRPTRPAADVISVFSNAYSNRPVDTFSPDWEASSVSDLRIAGDDVKVYNIPTQLDLAVIEFATQTIDASGMTHLHIDIWAPPGTATTPFFGLGLFSFGADGVFSGEPVPSGDDSQAVVAVLQPELVFNQWLSLDIPLTRYTGTTLAETAHLAQIILRSDSIQLIVDNIYFYNDGSQAAQ